MVRKVRQKEALNDGSLSGGRTGEAVHLRLLVSGVFAVMSLSNLIEVTRCCTY